MRDDGWRLAKKVMFTTLTCLFKLHANVGDMKAHATELPVVDIQGWHNAV